MQIAHAGTRRCRQAGQPARRAARGCWGCAAGGPPRRRRSAGRRRHIQLGASASASGDPYSSSNSKPAGCAPDLQQHAPGAAVQTGPDQRQGPSPGLQDGVPQQERPRSARSGPDHCAISTRTPPPSQHPPCPAGTRQHPPGRAPATALRNTREQVSKPICPGMRRALRGDNRLARLACRSMIPTRPASTTIGHNSLPVGKPAIAGGNVVLTCNTCAAPQLRRSRTGPAQPWLCWQSRVSPAPRRETDPVSQGPSGRSHAAS